MGFIPLINTIFWQLYILDISKCLSVLSFKLLGVCGECEWDKKFIELIAYNFNKKFEHSTYMITQIATYINIVYLIACSYSI